MRGPHGWGGMCWARIPECVLVLLHRKPRCSHVNVNKETWFPPGREFPFFQKKSYFYFTQLPSSQKEDEITMEKVNTMEQGEGCLSARSTEAFPQEQLILPRKGGFSVLSPLIIFRFPRVAQACFQSNTSISVLCVLSDRAVWKAINVEARIGTRLVCDSETRGALQAGRVPLRKCLFLLILF